MAIMDWTLSDIKNYIRVKLGAPVTLVELSDSQLELAIYDALESFNTLIPNRVRFTLNVVQGSQVISIPDPGRGIVEVRCLKTPINLSGYSNFDVFSSRVITDTSSIGNYAETLSQQEDMSIVLGTEFDWVYEENEKKLYLGAVPSSATTIECIKLVNYTLDNLPFRYQKWVRSYSVATAKQTLGRLLSKVKSIPGGTGDLTLDGEDLIQQGREDAQLLLDQLDSMRTDSGIYLG